MAAPLQISIAAGAAVVLAVAVWILLRYLRKPKDPEKYRRDVIDAGGRIIEATLMDYREGVVFYKWSWRGVDYESSQNLGPMVHLLPSQELLPGPASVKFLPRNPSNSIVMSEKWNGFRFRKSALQPGENERTPLI